ncbi:hypothetical protein BP6252_05694 [Coleophoma cylindrospora]|uniref:ubiquitinyl hydrolase 1 n=1 Tax=Coleophoma cylindrospora TaxID=1849047 RepID=A0A3D8RV10_9HELO|nr:hypothetical protein BP6252_05694 [Coleophoma cylindrospora]
MFQPQPTPYSPLSSYGLIGSTPGAAADFNYEQHRSPSVVDNGGPTVFRDPVFRPSSGLPSAFHTLSPPPRFKMEAPNPADDLERQEAMAREYKPNLEGPLVGEKKSSVAIAEEYAKADPVYVAKTAHLPQTYSHYRQIQGDGNCGWRAAAFSYFEILVQTGDKAKIEEELARMTSFGNLLANVGGFDSWLCEDMSGETLDLLKDLASIPDQTEAMGLVLEKLNDRSISDTIVYHLRMLASSWLRADPGLYQGFIQGPEGLDGYCKEMQAVNQEIDHLGMTLLIDVLLKPIGVAVEIVYLDRSEGTQANTHLFEPTDSNGVPTHPCAPRIYLLYRPSHYDILYKEITALPIRQDLQVNRATSFSHQHAVQNTTGISNFSSVDMSAILGIPGFSMQPMHNLPPTYPYSDFAPSPMSPSISPITAAVPSPPAEFPLCQKTLLQLPVSVGTPTSFRPSKYNWEAASEWQDTPTFQTNTFKNSHYNTAHYNNSNFQPEQWSPENEEPSTSRKKTG